MASPGLLGWVAVGAVVGIADGWALRTGRETMSTFFARHRGWAIAITGGVVAHLVMHEVPTQR